VAGPSHPAIEGGTLHLVVSLVNPIVWFEYERPPTQSTELAADLQGIVLSEDLYARLREAADLSQVTAFERHLEEVQTLGPAGRHLAVRLSGLNQRYDRDALLEFMEGIPHE